MSNKPNYYAPWENDNGVLIPVHYVTRLDIEEFIAAHIEADQVNEKIRMAIEDDMIVPYQIVSENAQDLIYNGLPSDDYPSGIHNHPNGEINEESIAN